MSLSSLFRQCDFHVHTHLSPCAQGEMRLPSIIEVCARRGIRYLGITDHIFAFTDPRILVEARGELARLKKPMDVFLGCEADVVGVGRHMVTEEMRSTLDFIAVSANHFHLDSVEQPEDRSLRGVGQHFLRMFRYACSLEFADVVVHPMIAMPGTYDSTSLELLTDDELMDALVIARDNQIAMEISPRALMPDQMHFRLRFYSLCKRAGLKFSFGSDAHRLETAGRTDVLEPIVRELGLTDADIWLPARQDTASSL